MKLPPGVLARVLELSDPPSPPPAPPIGGAHHRDDDGGSAGWRLVVALPGVRVVSEANRRDHWAARHRRAKGQRAAVLAALAGVPVPAGRVRVVFVRRGGRSFDTDNLAGAFKACRDAVAAWLGCDDAADAPIRWAYRLEAGNVKDRVVIAWDNPLGTAPKEVTVSFGVVHNGCPAVGSVRAGNAGGEYVVTKDALRAAATEMFASLGRLGPFTDATNPLAAGLEVQVTVTPVDAADRATRAVSLPTPLKLTFLCDCTPVVTPAVSPPTPMPAKMGG